VAWVTVAGAWLVWCVCIGTVRKIDNAIAERKKEVTIYDIQNDPFFEEEREVYEKDDRYL